MNFSRNSKVVLLLLPIYIIFASIFTFTFEIDGDTANYEKLYSDISGLNFLYLYGFEFVVPGIASIFKLLGFDFREFLLFSILAWYPVLLIISNRFGLITFLITFPFFCSYFFLDNLVFLLRQYYAALFFICYASLKKSKPIKFVFCTLSMFSHLSAIFWFLIHTEFFARIFRLFHIRLILLFFVFICLVFKIDLVADLMGMINHYNLETGLLDIDRKVAYYIYNDSNISDHSLKYSFYFYIIIFNFITLFFYVSNKMQNNNLNKISVFLYVQSALVILLSENIVAANRVGFFAYYFAIPIFIYLFLNLFFFYAKSSRNSRFVT